VALSSWPRRRRKSRSNGKFANSTKIYAVYNREQAELVEIPYRLTFNHKMRAAIEQSRSAVVPCRPMRLSMIIYSMTLLNAFFRLYDDIVD
jgi:hypothetical protein